jgi:acyl carrier protein
VDAEPRQDTVPIRLAEIWRETLQVANVGEDSDFFELGGHSLLAIRVSVRASEAFDVEVPSGDLIADSSFRTMAERIEAARHEAAA